MSKSRSSSSPVESQESESPSLSRRLLIGAAAGASLSLIGCTGGTEAGSPGVGGSGGTVGGGGEGGLGGKGAGGKGGNGGNGNTNAKKDAGGSAGGESGSGGYPEIDASGAGGAGGAGNTGSPDAGDFPDGATIEMGRPDGMTDVATMSCGGPTDRADEGPFYMANAPFRNVLAQKSDGEWLIVTGRVLSTKCVPLANAVVDVWHSNGAPDGKSDYDNQKGGTYRWRGRMRTDASGNYMYETVKPGRYNNGGSLRPCHIHYMISAAGHTGITTQFQPKGDPHFDSIAKHSLDVPFVKEGDLWKSTIDIVLRPSAGAVLVPSPREIREVTAGRLPRRRFFFLGGRGA